MGVCASAPWAPIRSCVKLSGLHSNPHCYNHIVVSKDTVTTTTCVQKHSVALRLSGECVQAACSAALSCAAPSARSRRPAVIARTTAAIRSASRRRRRIEIRLCSSSRASQGLRAAAVRARSPHPSPRRGLPKRKDLIPPPLPRQLGALLRARC